MVSRPEGSARDTSGALNGPSRTCKGVGEWGRKNPREGYEGWISHIMADVNF